MPGSRLSHGCDMASDDNHNWAPASLAGLLQFEAVKRSEESRRAARNKRQTRPLRGIRWKAKYLSDFPPYHPYYFRDFSDTLIALWLASIWLLRCALMICKIGNMMQRVRLICSVITAGTDKSFWGFATAQEGIVKSCMTTGLANALSLTLVTPTHPYPLSKRLC